MSSELDPRLTARHGGGHIPLRVVMSRTLNLPEQANVWDTKGMSTMVVTQRGAKRSFQKLLASKGVEVVEFDNLNPRDVMEYFHDRGFLSILWECGGTLAASAIASGVIHEVMIFSFLIYMVDSHVYSVYHLTICNGLFFCLGVIKACKKVSCI